MLLGCGWGVIGLWVAQWSRIGSTMHRVWGVFGLGQPYSEADRSSATR